MLLSEFWVLFWGSATLVLNFTKKMQSILISPLSFPSHFPWFLSSLSSQKLSWRGYVVYTSVFWWCLVQTTPPVSLSGEAWSSMGRDTLQMLWTSPPWLRSLMATLLVRLTLLQSMSYQSTEFSRCAHSCTTCWCCWEGLIFVCTYRVAVFVVVFVGFVLSAIHI